MDEQVERLNALTKGTVIEMSSQDNVTRLIEPRRPRAREKLYVADAADQYLRVRRLQQDGTPLLRYYKGEWYRYNGTIYVRRDMDEIKADVMRYIRQVDRRRANTGFQTGVLANLQSLCEMPNHVDWPAMWTGTDWETRPDLIVVENGVVDITAAVSSSADDSLMPHTPFFLSTVLLPFAYDLHAVCPRWESFLGQILPDPDCRLLIQEMFGYCLTFDTRQQKFFLLLGEGANGKGVILRILRMLLGPENVSSVPLSRLGERFDLALTLGKLVNLSSEVDNVRQVDEAILKQFTGEDPMRFERKYKDGFSAMPTAKLIIAANSPLPFRDRSEGIWRRLIAIPFPITIPEVEQNKSLTTELAEEMGGIFNWSVVGLGRLRQQGRFTQPISSQNVLAEFRREANTARLFLEEYCTEQTDAYVMKGDLYQSYCAFCRQERHEPIKSNEFSKEVLKQFPSVKGKARPRVGESRITSYGGLSLNHDAPAPFV